MAETEAYHILKKAYPHAHWQRIEGWSTIGVSDTNACQDGVEAWIELKEVTVPKRSSTLVRSKKIRPSQIAWEFQRRHAGGRTFIALRYGDQVYLLRGKHLKDLREGVSQEWLRDNRLDMRTLFDRHFTTQ